MTFDRRDDTLIEELTLKCFGRIWPLHSVRFGETLQQSGGRLVRVLTASEGKFVFKVANVATPEEDVIRDTFAFGFLKERGFVHIPDLLKTRTDHSYSRVGDRLVCVMECVEGTSNSRTPENWAQLAEIAAELHDITGYPYVSTFTVKDETAKFPETAAKLPFEKAFMELAHGLPDLASLSRSIIHTDLGLANVVLRPDGRMVLVDLDDIGVGTTILDVACPLMYFIESDKDRFQRDRAKAFYDAYFARRRLPEGERELIFDAGIWFFMEYLGFGNPQRGWQQIQYALKNREEIEAAILG